MLAPVLACTGPVSPPPSTAKSPVAAATGDEAVLAKVREWLSHPNEHGRPPERAAIVWRGQRAWPFVDKPQDVYLVEFSYSGERGIAVAGPITWAFLSIDFARFAHEDLVKLYAGWYIQFMMLNTPEGQKAQGKKSSDSDIANALTAQGFTSIEVDDSVQIGDDTYFAARAMKDGASVIAAGYAGSVKTYDPGMTQMLLPPLYWYLGSTFYSE